MSEYMTVIQYAQKLEAKAATRSGVHTTPLTVIATIIGSNIVESLAKAEEIITALEGAGFAISPMRQEWPNER